MTNLVIFVFTSLILFLSSNSFNSNFVFKFDSLFSKSIIIMVKSFFIFSCFSIFSLSFNFSLFLFSLLFFIKNAFSNNELILFNCSFNISDSIFNSFIFVINTDFFNFSNLSFSNFISVFVFFISFFILKNKLLVDEFLLLDKAFKYIESSK